MSVNQGQTWQSRTIHRGSRGFHGFRCAELKPRNTPTTRNGISVPPAYFAWSAVIRQIQRVLFNTDDNIATPCSMNA